MPKILIIGAGGQIGSELTRELRRIYGTENVVASDIKGSGHLTTQGVFEILDATNKTAINNCIKKHDITDVYLMAALLSATAEKYPDKAWELNMSSLFHVLDLAKEGRIKKYSGRVLLQSSDPQHLRKTPRNIPLRNPLRSMG